MFHVFLDLCRGKLTVWRTVKVATAAATESQKIPALNRVCIVVYYYYCYYQYDRPSFAFVSIRRIMAPTLLWKYTDSLIQAYSKSASFERSAYTRKMTPNRRIQSKKTMRRKGLAIYFFFFFFGTTSRAHIIAIFFAVRNGWWGGLLFECELLLIWKRVFDIFIEKYDLIWVFFFSRSCPGLRFEEVRKEK